MFQAIGLTCSLKPQASSLPLKPVAGPAEGPCGKGSFEGTGTPKGSNGEHGPQGGPTANKDQRGPTSNMDPKGVQRRTRTPRGSIVKQGPFDSLPSTNSGQAARSGQGLEIGKPKSVWGSPNSPANWLS